MKTEDTKSVRIDAREIPPDERHEKIIQAFKELSSGQTLYVISNHEPIHLLEQMRHEGLPLVEPAYTSVENSDGSYETTFVKGVDPQLANGVRVTSLDKERHYSKERFSPVGIYSTAAYKVIITYIKSGQCIPVHSPGVDLIFAVIKGSGRATAGEGEYTLEPGSILIVPKGERRGIVADTDMEAIHIVSPVPNEEDHLEVEKKLHAGDCA